MREVDESKDREDQRQSHRAESEVVAGDDAVDRYLPELLPPLCDPERKTGAQQQSDEDEPRMSTDVVDRAVARGSGYG